MRTAVLLLALLGAGVAQAIRFGALPTSLGPGRISSNSSGDDGTDNRGKHCRPSQVRRSACICGARRPIKAH